MKTQTGIVIFPILCILLSFFVLITDPTFTTTGLQKYSNAQNESQTKQLFAYFAGLNSIPEVFSSAEKSHLADVKFLIQSAFIALILLTMASIFCITKKNWKIILNNGFIALIILLTVCTIIPFDKLFTTFHHIFFPQGNWMFAQTSNLIQYYPSQFFKYYALGIAIHALIVGATLCFFLLMSKMHK